MRSRGWFLALPRSNRPRPTRRVELVGSTLGGLRLVVAFGDSTTPVVRNNVKATHLPPIASHRVHPGPHHLKCRSDCQAGSLTGESARRVRFSYFDDGFLVKLVVRHERDPHPPASERADHPSELCRREVPVIDREERFIGLTVGAH